jgi:alkylation response protein AidB-like acyl-CoA dehydrogenase
MRLPLQTKLLYSELGQDIAACALEIEGMRSTLYLGDEHAPDGGRWPLSYMNSYGMTIAAGTSEIQRNILGERVLGMAKSK